jgi:RNA polymerase sigma factor (sigma-70 family)
MSNPEASNEKAVEILSRLSSADSKAAWTEFLQEYSDLIFQVVRVFEKDFDAASDCFVFVCEQLSRRDFARLQKYNSMKASFATWLRAVVRNLLIDWHRQEFGRHRVFESVARMSQMEQEVFRCIFEQRLSEDHTVALLRSRFPDLDREMVSKTVEQISSTLTPRQRWLLANRNPIVKATGDDSEDKNSVQLRHLGPDPESAAIEKDLYEKLQKGLLKLPSAQQVLIRLRYEQGLSLTACAEFAGLETPQKADRRIRAILGRLQSLMEI